MEFTISDPDAHALTFLVGVLSGFLFFVAIVSCSEKDYITVESTDDLSESEDEFPESAMKRMMGKTQ